MNNLDNDAPTIRLPNQGFSQLGSPPRLGTLKRVAQADELPQELTVYKLEPIGTSPRHLHIGRNRQRNAIVINNPTVSREHAILTQRHGSLYLSDKGSTLGTFLNGMRLESTSEMLIRHGDLVSFGNTMFEYQAAPSLSAYSSRSGQRIEPQSKEASSQDDTLSDGPFRYLARSIINHCNKVQFFGFEIANIVLIGNEIMLGNTNAYGLNWETLAVLVLLCGGSLIWQFDAEKRPHMLPYGALFIVVGGLLLSCAGYFLTGLATAWSALETARGGLALLNEQLVGSTKNELTNMGQERLQKHRQIIQLLLGWYLKLLTILLVPFPKLAQLLNERPFLIGNASKAPLRLEFIYLKWLVGDWIGVGVGLSWMILGDGALILNDQKLRTYLLRVLAPRSVHSRNVVQSPTHSSAQI